MNLYLTRDWRPAPAHDSFGHDVETAYLLVEAAEALGMPDDAATWQVARSLVDHALDWGWDDEHGGFYDKGDVFAGRRLRHDQGLVDPGRGAQRPAADAPEISATRPTATGEAFRKQWAFIEAHQLDPEHGGWFGEVTREGKLIGDGRKATQWKANYHTSRALMNVATMLGELARDSP